MYYTAVIRQTADGGYYFVSFKLPFSLSLPQMMMRSPSPRPPPRSPSAAAAGVARFRVFWAGPDWAWNAFDFVGRNAHTHTHTHTI